MEEWTHKYLKRSYSAGHYVSLPEFQPGRCLRCRVALPRALYARILTCPHSGTRYNETDDLAALVSLVVADQARKALLFSSIDFSALPRDVTREVVQAMARLLDGVSNAAVRARMFSLHAFCSGCIDR